MENRFIDKVSFEEKENRLERKKKKKDKLNDEVDFHELPTQLVSSSSSEEESDQNATSEEDDDDRESEEEEDVPGSSSNEPPSLPDEPEYGTKRLSCPFEDCYLRLKTKNGFFKHLNTVHSHEPKEVIKEIEETLKVHGFIPLGEGETGTSLQKKRYKQTALPKEL